MDENLKEQLRLLSLIKRFKNIKAIHGYSLLDEVEQLKDTLSLLDRDWSVLTEDILYVKSLFIVNQKYTKEEMTKVCNVTTEWITLTTKIAEKREYISSQIYIYEQLFLHLEAQEISEEDLQRLALEEKE